jgi:CRP-like cAMP-binding protein
MSGRFSAPKGSRERSWYRRAEVIFTQGDPCESILYIQKSGVKLSVLSKTSREAVVAMLPHTAYPGGTRAELESTART